MKNRNLAILNKKKKLNLIFKIYKKVSTINSKKLAKFNSLSKAKRFKIILRKIKEKHPMLLKKLSSKKIYSFVKSKTQLVFKTLKQSYQSSNKFLTKGLRKILIKFPKVNPFSLKKQKLQKRLIKMNRIFKKKKMRRNFSKRTFFFKIVRKTRKHKIKLLRLNRKKPIFTKKTRKEKKFLLRARESLLKTKKYLYRKQFPKIKGKKNKNFNFFYYNNIDRIPFKFHIGRIVITYLLNNTFINIHSSKKMLKVLSAGKLGFKGPKRSTPYSRQVVARKAIKFISKTKLNVLDIFLNSNYNRWYYFIFKEISKPRVKPYVIRYLVISNPRPHGFIRDRKHRRK